MAITIGDLGKATGTRVETIRYYERVGLLPAPPRTQSNYRSYGRRNWRACRSSGAGAISASRWIRFGRCWTFQATGSGIAPASMPSPGCIWRKWSANWRI